MECEKQIVKQNFVPILKRTKALQSEFPIMNWPEAARVPITVVVLLLIIDLICSPFFHTIHVECSTPIGVCGLGSILLVFDLIIEMQLTGLKIVENVNRWRAEVDGYKSKPKMWQRRGTSAQNRQSLSQNMLLDLTFSFITFHSSELIPFEQKRDVHHSMLNVCVFMEIQIQTAHTHIFMPVIVTLSMVYANGNRNINMWYAKTNWCCINWNWIWFYCCWMLISISILMSLANRYLKFKRSSLSLVVHALYVRSKKQ